MSTTSLPHEARRPRRPARRQAAADGAYLGPHFRYDIIRLARKGWPTLLRAGYLGLLLLSLLVMYETQGNTLRLQRLSDYAQRAHAYAYTLLVVQYLLVLAMMPVYVASAIAEEKENRTLEALSLTHLSDRELVLGKLAARLVHVGAIVLSGFPLLVFMRLWGNVDISLLLYHEVNTLFVLVTAGSICIWVSTRSASVFQALTNSYPPLLLLAVFGMGAAFVLPWASGFLVAATAALFNRLLGVAGPRFAAGAPVYLPNLLLLLPLHAAVCFAILRASIRRMDYVRLEETKAPRKVTGAFALADTSQPAPAKGKKRKHVSRIHPFALPIGETALFWKECLKDGSAWSLRCRWAFVGLALVVGAALSYWMLFAVGNTEGRSFLRYNAFSFAYTSYFIALAAYALVVLFQTTTSVAGEREQDTLVFLLLVPEERGAILAYKWLGPFWRNWPILAIAYLGAFLGVACGLYHPLVFLLLLLLPWPFLLMITSLALWLSVVSRRVLFANIGIVGFLALLFVLHVVLRDQSTLIFRAYLLLLFGEQGRELNPLPLPLAGVLLAGEQALFLTTAIVFGTLAFWRFRAKEYASAG